ncbi:LysR family transcriptional regulator [[Pasteurella] aerogenes]|nr:LysR family transcriptional regulator [[Pasteurella] aerogenes]
MQENLNDLRAFVIVAQSGSFTKAGASLGVSTSALSHTIKSLEERLKIKLFHRTTRSISTTEAGEQLFEQLAPLLADIELKINELSLFRDTLKGKLHLNGSDHAFIFALWDKLQAFMEQYPEVELELTSEQKFSDIVAERFDAGIRLGADVEKDMIAVKIADDMQMCVVASPDYLAKNGTPKQIDDLAHHQCLRLRLPTSGGIMAWEFEQHGKTLKFHPQSQLIASSNRLLAKACLEGRGLLWLPKDSIAGELRLGLLVECLAKFSIRYDGYHLYYPNRRQNSPLFRALVEALKE